MGRIAGTEPLAASIETAAQLFVSASAEGRQLQSILTAERIPGVNSPLPQGEFRSDAYARQMDKSVLKHSQSKTPFSIPLIVLLPKYTEKQQEQVYEIEV